jgi:hypothetical protein
VAKYYVDTEFDGFLGDLISIALVPEDASHPSFYGAVECLSPTPWVAEHVMPFVGIEPESLASLRQRLTAYLISDPHPHIIADWPEDITHLTRLLITGPGMMVPIRTMSFEYRDLPHFSSAKSSAIPHNALEDARALRDYMTTRDDW